MHPKSKPCLSLSDVELWAIDNPRRLRTLLATLDSLQANPQTMVAGQDLEARNRSRTVATEGNVAILPIRGVIMHRHSWVLDWIGGTSVEGFSGMLDQALADESVRRIVLDIDSPGGMVAGVQELASKIHRSRETKSITAVANSKATSAAYWLGSQASEFVGTPSSEIGSVGVMVVHREESKKQALEGITTTLIYAGENKTEGNPWEPLTEEAHDWIQKQVDTTYKQFTGDVARGRGVSRAAVLEGFGAGRVFLAPQAKTNGLIDRIATMDQVLASNRGRSRKSAAAKIALASLDV